MIWDKKYGNFPNPPAEQSRLCKLSLLRLSLIGSGRFIFQSISFLRIFQMFGIFTTTYSINVFMNSVFLFVNSPKISNIILQIFEILRYSLRWRLPFINLCRYITIYFPAINPKVSIICFLCVPLHPQDLT